MTKTDDLELEHTDPAIRALYGTVLQSRRDRDNMLVYLKQCEDDVEHCAAIILDLRGKLDAIASAEQKYLKAIETLKGGEAVKERPIIFSAPMVRAILDGSKTQTRRVAKGIEKIDEYYLKWEHNGFAFYNNDYFGGKAACPFPCPYGAPGDRLWVRENTEADHNTYGVATYSRYCADKSSVLYSGCKDHEYNGSVAHWDYPRDVRPSIHMPRWASRITLEITDVRVERLQDISETDACAEGCGEMCGPTAKDAFRWLWMDINGDASWDANPWIWVVEFNRV